MDLYNYIYIIYSASFSHTLWLWHVFELSSPQESKQLYDQCLFLSTPLRASRWTSGRMSLNVKALGSVARNSSRVGDLHVPCATHFAKSIQIDNIIPYEDLYVPLQPSHSLTHLVPCNLEALFQVRWVSCFNRCSVTLPSTLAQDGTFTCPLPYLAVLMSGEEMGRHCCGETKRGSLVAIFCGDSWDLNSSTAPFSWTCDLCWPLEWQMRPRDYLTHQRGRTRGDVCTNSGGKTCNTLPSPSFTLINAYV